MKSPSGKRQRLSRRPWNSGESLFLTPPSPTGSSRRRPAMPSSGGTCPDSSSHLSGKVRWGSLQETPGVLPCAISLGGIKVVHPLRMRNEGGETLAHVDQGGGGFSIPGNMQGQAGWDMEQPSLLGSVSLHGGWMRKPKKSPFQPNQSHDSLTKIHSQSSKCPMIL